MARKALITGISGQDGAYLARLLLDQGYEVTGIARSLPAATDRLQALGAAKAVRILDADLADAAGAEALLRDLRPDEVYNLAGLSFVASSYDDPGAVATANAVLPAQLLRAIRIVDPAIRYYQASSSEMFGPEQRGPQTEATPFLPHNPYAASKVFAHTLTGGHREHFGLHASAGICFNHESPLRGLAFLTRKTTLGLARIRHGRQAVLELGNLGARRDWGFAGDYVDAMWRMVRRDIPGDYILATGRAETVRRFVELAADPLGFRLEWEGEGLAETGRDRVTGRVVVRVAPAFYRPPEPGLLVGDATKAQRELGWVPRVGLAELAGMMAEADDRRLREGLLD